MKDWKSISSHFYFLMVIATLLTLLDIGARIFYACNKADWLEWSVKGAYPAIFGFLLLIGFPCWLGARCRLCPRRSIFLFGMLFNLGMGVISNVASTLQWQIFLTRCMPAIYATTGGWQAIVIAWLFLPMEIVLGGVAASIGQKIEMWRAKREEIDDAR